MYKNKILCKENYTLYDIVCKTTRKIIQKRCVPKKYSLIEYIVTPMSETAGKVGLG